MHRGPRSQVTRSRGLTLIELMVAIVITALLSAGILTSFAGLSVHHVEADARKLAADIAWAREMAMARNQNHILVLDAANDQYIVYRGSIAAANQLKQQALTSDLTTTGQITFNAPNGLSATDWQIILTKGSSSRQIDVYRTTGFVRIQ